MVPYTKIKDSPEPWNTDKDRDVSKKLALESVVLLKNENSILPLDKDKIKSIAVIGPLADSVHWDWYGGTPPYAVTPLQGIKDEVGPNVKVNYAAYDTQAGEDDAMNAAKNSDVAIVVIGNDPTCGDEAHAWYNSPGNGGGITLPCTVPSDGREGRDRESIDLAQEQLVKQVFIKNPKTIVLLISSFPFAINWTEANVPAILTMAHSSQDEGTALAKVLFGDYNPGGHLMRDVAEVSRSASAEHGLQHPRRLHVHVLQRRATLSLRLWLELHDFQILESADKLCRTWRKTEQSPSVWT